MQYRIAATLGGLSADNLLSEPHPTPFFEEQDDSHLDLSGRPIPLGKAHCLWQFKDNILEAAQWQQYMNHLSGARSVWRYIVTRTNQTSGGVYVYAPFLALMHRPKGESRAQFRYQNVEIEFTEMIAQ